MPNYASIGTLYYLQEQYGSPKLIWSVIENNFNEKTSTLMVVESCEEYGKKVKVDAKWLYDKTPIGPIIPQEGEIVIENGREFIRPIQEKIKSR